MSKRRHLSLWVNRNLGAKLDALRGLVPMSRYVEHALEEIVDGRVLSLRPPERRAYEARVCARLAELDRSEP